MVGAWRDRSETSTSPGRELPAGMVASRNPDPSPAEHADQAESAARYAVEGVGITANRDRHPTRAAGAAQNGLSP